MLTLVTNIFRHSFLLMQFVRADVIGRYKASYLGVLWMVISPLILFALYVFVFSVVLRVRFPEQGSIYFYSVNLFCGLIAWNAFADSLGRSATVLTANSGLVKKTLFPVEILSLSLSLSSMVRFVVELALFVLALALMGFKITWAFCWLPLIVFLQLIFTISLCWIFSAIGVLVKDLVQLIGPMLTVWFFMTPVVYPETLAQLPEKWNFVAAFIHINPMTKFISVYRGILLFGYFHFTANVIQLIFGVFVLFFFSAWSFNRLKPFLAENL